MSPRPKKPDARRRQINVRATEEQEARIRQLAEQAGMTVSDWILLRATTPEGDPSPHVRRARLEALGDVVVAVERMIRDEEGR